MRVVTAFAVVLLLAACGADGEPETPGPKAPKTQASLSTSDSSSHGAARTVTF